MFASSSTFRPQPGRGSQGSAPSVVCFMAWYGSTGLQQSSKGSCSLHVSGPNLWVDCQWSALVPPLNSGANAVLISLQALSAVQALMSAVVAMKQQTIVCYTLCVSREMNGVTLSYCYSGDYPTRE